MERSNGISINKKRRLNDIETNSTTLMEPLNKIEFLSPESSLQVWSGKSKKLKVDSYKAYSTNLKTSEESTIRLNDDIGVNTIQDPNIKPPYSYAMLIGFAILQSNDGRLTLSQIYTWIFTHFLYYKPNDTGWQNSIRHNLSLNEAFVKGGKSLDGKGHFWQIKKGFESKFFKKSKVQTGKEAKKKSRNVNKLETQCNENQKSACFNTNINVQKLSPKGKDKKSSTFKTGYNSEFKNINWDSFSLDSHLQMSNSSTPFDSKCNYFTGNIIDKYQFEGDDEPYFNKNFSYECNQYIKHQHSEGFKNCDLASSDHFLLEAPRLILKRPNTILKSHQEIHSNFNDLDQFPKFKKYTCSFNTSFESISPISKVSNSDILTDRVETPRPTTSIFLTETPTNDGTTPKEHQFYTNWQTPSLLFEDFVDSSVFMKPFGTPNTLTDDCLLDICDNTQIDIKYSKKLSDYDQYTDPNSSFEDPRYSSSRLFGVDVYSIWKRAVGNRCESIQEDI